LYQEAEKRLSALINSGSPDALCGGSTGLEKESLRVGPDGSIAQTPHPAALGSALTHPWITTDYSEALLEFITPPFTGLADALGFLRLLQHYVYLHLDNELLWSASMPCVVEGESFIPLARYGHSNAGTMKTVYRRGLGYRYGRVMQVIAGGHYNYSFPDTLWPVYRELSGDDRPQQDFISERYFDTIRNLQRYGWLVPYLFGSSPAICKSFLCGTPTELQDFNKNTYYAPYATSLRMCDIGYQNSQEGEAGFKANYDSLPAYIDSLTRAIETPCPRYQEIGVKVDGRHRQLNANILQIENEYYSSVRPKQVPEFNEKPTHALHRRGVRYVELRSLDINLFDPLGISETQCRFLETFMAFCLFQASPVIDDSERREIDYNLDAVCYRGRKPGLELQRNGSPIGLSRWADELLDAMHGFAELLDTNRADKVHVAALQAQRAAVRDPDLTPSAQIIAGMRRHGEGHFHFAQRMSRRHHEYFLNLPANPEGFAMIDAAVEKSIADQQAMEAADNQSFDEFLADYFARRMEDETSG
jgi:glutamate--cysteine ligase